LICGYSSLELRGQALLDRSRVLAMRGDRQESRDLARRARQLFDMRQSPVLVRRATDLIDALTHSSA
jgi:hypothetical protein